MMKKQLLVSFFLLSFLHPVLAQITPAIDWQKCLGGTGNEAAFSVEQTSDGGYISAGYSDSNDGDVSGNHGSNDYWVMKLDANSNLEWQKSLGGSSIDQANSVKQTIDGGFVVAGYTYSTNDDVTGNHGSSDYWVVKLGTAGDLIWQKTLGGSSDDGANSIQQTDDGGFIVAGYSSSNNDDVSGNHGMWDYWIVKLDSSGNLTWQKSLGGTNNDVAYFIQQTDDGGYVISGYSESNDGDVAGNNGARDYWIVRLDTGGELVWQTHLGSSGYDEAFGVQQTSDGFLVAGFAGSNDFDVSGNHGGYDYWIVKLDSSGSMLSQTCFGGTNTDQAFSLNQTTGGGFVVAGQSLSTNGDVTGNHGGYDFWIVKIDADATLEWQKSLGGSSDDYGPYNIQQTIDGGFILGGASLSNDDDVSGNHGGAFYGDCWIVKLAGGKATGISSPVNYLFSVYPNPAQDELNIESLQPLNDVSVHVFDVAGKMIALPILFDGTRLQLKTSALADGIYSLLVVNLKTNEEGVLKFVKSE